jgi:hypothetical protein
MVDDAGDTGEGCELHRRRPTKAIGIIKKRTRLGIVDNAIIRVGRRRAKIEGTSRKASRPPKGREYGVFEQDGVVFCAILGAYQ